MVFFVFLFFNQTSFQVPVPEEVKPALRKEKEPPLEKTKAETIQKKSLAKAKERIEVRREEKREEKKEVRVEAEGLLDLERTPSGRVRRRSAQVAVFHLQEIAEDELAKDWGTKRRIKDDLVPDIKRVRDLLYIYIYIIFLIYIYIT